MTRLPPLSIEAPATVEEATELLDRHGEEAAVYCGGTELLLLLKLRYAEYLHLVDVKGIPELRNLEALDGGGLRIGAAVTHRELERSPLVLDRLPALAAMERRVANLRVRNAGTLGGNLCFADPHSDPATFLLALEADVLTRRGGEGARRLPLSEFLLGPYRTALEPGALLVTIEVPPPAPGTSIVHRKLAFRERPAATVCCAVTVEGSRVADLRIAVGAVGPVPVRVREAEAALVGSELEALGPGRLRAAGEQAAAASGAVDDANGSAEYKRQLVRVLTERALAEALGPAA